MVPLWGPLPLVTEGIALLDARSCQSQRPAGVGQNEGTGEGWMDGFLSWGQLRKLTLHGSSFSVFSRMKFPQTLYELNSKVSMSPSETANTTLAMREKYFPSSWGTGCAPSVKGAPLLC